MLRIVPRPRPRAGLAVLSMSLFLAVGCGGDSPRSSADRPVVVPDLKLTPAPSSDAEPVSRLAMILPQGNSIETNIWEQSARRTAGNFQTSFEALRPVGATSEQGQVALIDQAIRNGASALIIVPEDPQTLGPALTEARAQGIPSVSILRPIPVEGEPIPVILRSPAAEVAEDLVRAVQEDAQTVGYPAEGPALLLLNEQAVDADERAEALTKAAESAGMNLFGGQPARFDGRYEQALSIIQEARQQEPKLAIVLVIDDTGFRAATSLREKLDPDERYVMAGYVGDRRNMNMVAAAFASAAAEYNDIDIGILAAKTAMRLHRGDPIPAEISIKPKFQRALGPPSRSGLSLLTLDPATVAQRPASP
ncbi:hypothetical protein BH23PLA1_BH23PLA1_15490 [soil metagenome]